MSDLMCRIEKYAKVEDETRHADQKEAGSGSGKRGRDRGRRADGVSEKKSVFEAVNTVFKEPIFRILPQICRKPYFQYPRRLPDFSGKEEHKDLCAFHRDRGHRIGACRSFKHYLEELVKQGHLKEYIDEAKTREAEAPPRAKREDQRRRRDDAQGGEAVEEEAPTRNRARRDYQRPAVIHVIHMENRPRSVVAHCQDAQQSSRGEEIMEVAGPSSSDEETTLLGGSHSRKTKGRE